MAAEEGDGQQGGGGADGGKREEQPPLPPDIEELHREVVARGEEAYEDPATGYTVFSAVFHK